MDNAYNKLVFVTNWDRRDISRQEYLDIIKSCVRYGVTSIQIREKQSSKASIVEFYYDIRKVLGSYKVPIIINDDIELAKDLNADGVHLGQDDGDPLHARSLLGNNKIIGISVNSEAELKSANLLPVDYVGVGAIFPTESKSDISKIWGVEGLLKLSKISKHPIIAIGGINELNASRVISAGADGIAAIGVFHNIPSPEVVVRKLRKIIDKRSSYYD